MSHLKKWQKLRLSKRLKENMNRIFLIITLTIFFVLAACSSSSKPNIETVSVTEPWVSINFPCKNEAVVVVSNEKIFKCAYGEKSVSRDKEVKIVMDYVEILKKGGWKVTKEIPDVAVQSLLEKDGKEILITTTSPSIITKDGIKKWEGYGIQVETWTKDK